MTLNLHANYGGQPLAMDQAYPFGTNVVKFDQFNFFISNVTLLEAETEDETDLMEIGLADFGTSSNASFSFSTVPAVKYRGMKISFGVPSGLNKSSVSNYGSGHPLKKAFDTHFWADGNSFFFMKLSGTDSQNRDFELFPAKNSNFMTVIFPKTFTLADGESLDLDLSVDVLKLLLYANSQPIDFDEVANLSTYNPENDDLSALLMSNFDKDKALELE